MVKSETLFCRLVNIDTLLSFDGIIPSAADFQLRLTTILEQFSKALLAENQTVTDSEALCQALCHYFDKRLISKQNNALSWQRYSLVHCFYGHSETEQALTLSVRLDVLLSTESEGIFRYAWKLLTMLIQCEGQTASLLTLRAAHRVRYFSRARPACNLITNETASWTMRHPVTPGAPGLMVFIIGPFASKWFSQSDLSSRSENSIVWIVAEHVSTLVNRLAHVEKHHAEIASLAFFPLLADGFENSGIMIEQITAWQYTFSATRLPHPLICMLGLYTRLSQKRFPHDPDRAIWTGCLDAVPKTHIKLEPRLINLINELDTQDDGSDYSAMQRYATGSTLVAWLAESRIMNVLQNLFDSTQLELAGVTLADHGQGFTRHGAWSRWLSEKYGILPGLSASITQPPLPTILQQAAIGPEPDFLQQPAILAPPLTTPRRCWPRAAAQLVLCVCLSGGIYSYGQRHIDRIREQFSQIAPGWIPIENSEADNKTAWFTLSGTAPLFENGSSDLMPDSEKVLAELVPKIVRRPQQQFLIIGHSDNTGSAALNLALSTQRARVIRDWLTEHTGLPASHFIVEGAGNSRPVASNDTREGRAQNRRVEIIPLSLHGN